MSQQNVELVRAAYDLFNRRDIEGFLDLADPEIVGVALFVAELPRRTSCYDPAIQRLRGSPHQGVVGCAVAPGR